MEFTEEQINEISHSELAAIASIFSMLVEQNRQHLHRVQELERLLGQNSNNSSSPPLHQVMEHVLKRPEAANIPWTLDF